MVRMKTIDLLNSEHGVFLTQLKVLKHMLHEKVSTKELKWVVRTIAEAVDNHRVIEEKTIYRQFKRKFGKNFPLIKTMEREHEKIEWCLKHIDSGRENTREIVQTFIRVLEEHIKKEIMIVFPMIEKELMPEELECEHVSKLRYR